MKIAFVSNSNYKGGADLSAEKIFKILEKNKININYFLRFSNIKKKNYIIIGNNLINKIRALIFFPIKKIIKEKDFSFNILYSSFFNKNYQNFDLINFHWLGSETISLNEILRINKPIVFTLHDEWIYKGGEHYFNFKKSRRNLIFNILNKYLINKKKKIFKKKNVYFICPSRWIKKQLIKSYKIKPEKIRIIPYPVDKEIFRPLYKNKILKKKIGLFITASNINDERKGFDILQKCMSKLDKNYLKLKIVGSKNKNFDFKQKYEIKNFTNSKYEISKIINSCDYLLFPSRADNLPNVILECLSCAKPVVAFNVGGISDVVKNKFNGYLAKTNDIDDFIKGIDYVNKNYKKIVKNIKFDSRFKQYIDEKNIFKKHYDFYKKIILKN